MNQVASTIPNGIIAAVAFYAFERSLPVAFHSRIALPGYDAALPIGLIGVVFSFFVLTALLPYLLGTRWAREQLNQMLAQRRELIESLLQNSMQPSPAAFVAGVENAITHIDGLSTDFLSTHLYLARMIDLNDKNEDDLTPEEELQISTYESFSNVDPRFSHIKLLFDFRDQLKALSDELKGKVDSEIKARAVEYQNYMMWQKMRLTEEVNDTKENGQSRLVGGITLALGAIGSTILGKVGQLLWEWAITMIRQS
ncbi:MAG: hypothetical protein ABL907_24105 [Hyphomicrobium sp.]